MYATGNKKMLNMLILEILREYSDQEHRLTQQEIVRLLKSDYDMDCDRRSVKNNILCLKELGYEISMESGYCLLEREFDDAELRHGDNKQLMYVLDTVNEAISQHKKISFIYNLYGSDFKLRPKRKVKYVVNPYQMAVNNGFYYLIGNYDRYDDISHYRLDKMTCVEMLPDKVKPQKQVVGLEHGLNLPKHMAEHIYMFSGESVAINMLVKEIIISELVDWFGKDFYVIEQRSDNQLLVRLKCNERAFFHWALQYGSYVEVLEPVVLRNKIAETVSEMNEKYHRKEK